jgi:hypothetical protein
MFEMVTANAAQSKLSARARRARRNAQWISLRGTSPEDFIAEDVLERISTTD